MSEQVLLVRVAELATLISLSPRKIEYLRQDRCIPHVRCGRAVLYSPPAVVAALEKLGRVPVAGEPRRKMQRLTAADIGGK